MRIDTHTQSELATMLTQERKRQKLSRSQAAAVCDVSPSFIRDAETHPERCSLGKLALLINGLGLTMLITDSKPRP
ncbi:MAG: helix-turn-helix domain-containing protein [Burkholderiaceae bacterium]|nr:helix-turn-helix domain-containing protein [Caldisericota bacterium]MDP3137204.1 helix-turn-helix domain-containing protein [Burkholderiaceae bacterium]